ncbi:hypothetical protein HanRHA438_Chr13g0585481 [Helianthus annuus]|nr:hypothetical protein HanIR_Chr13g0625431 [Helianthus annuus]KAJ0857043.1 hypothetical protein HanRHA438_Chr13g0585481 [Helianthus annuus]
MNFINGLEVILRHHFLDLFNACQVGFISSFYVQAYQVSFPYTNPFIYEFYIHTR